LTGYEIDNSDIVCSHGQLNPFKFSEAGEISASAFKILVQDLNYKISHTLKYEEPCGMCFTELMKNYIATQRHLDQIASINVKIQASTRNKDKNMYYISKVWFTGT
jgi:hypothetical protein